MTIRRLQRMNELPKQSMGDVFTEFYRLKRIVRNDMDGYQKKYTVIWLVTIIEQFFRCAVEIKLEDNPDKIPERIELNTHVIDHVVDRLSRSARKAARNHIVSMTYLFQDTTAISNEMGRFGIDIFRGSVSKEDFAKLFKLRHNLVHTVDPQLLPPTEIQNYCAIIEKLMENTLEEMRHIDLLFYFMKGDALRELDDLNGATECFEKALDRFKLAIKYNPSNHDAYFGMGLAQQKLADHNMAVKSFDAIIGLKMDSADVHFSKGESLLHLKKYDEAVPCFDVAIDAKLYGAYAPYLKGVALHRLGKSEMALTCFDRAIENDPDDPRPHMEKWRILEKLKMPVWAGACLERAKECFDKILEENPAHVNVHFVIGNIFIDIKQIGKARVCFEKVLELDPKHEQARVQLDSIGS